MAVVVLEKSVPEAREEEYDKYNVPIFIRRRANKICDTFAIENPTDTLYIANVIAKILRCGDGHNVFNYEPSNSNFYESHIKTVAKQDAYAIRDKLVSIYNESIYGLSISNEVLLKIIINGTVSQDEELRLLKELVPIVEKEYETSEGWWKPHFQEKLDALKRRLQNLRFVENESEKYREMKQTLRNVGVDICWSEQAE